MSIFSRLAQFLIPPASVILQGGCAGNSEVAPNQESVTTRPVKMRLVSMYQTAAPIVGENIVGLAHRVEEASAGSIQIKVFDPGKLVASMEVLDAVSNGKVDAGYSTAGFWMGKIPAAPIFSAVPFGPGISEFLAWFLEGNGSKLYQEMYDQYGFNVKVLLCGMIPPETSGWFAGEIQTADDLKGLKMRFFGLGGTVMGKLGVAVNLLPPGEIFPALEKNVIDATEYALPVLDEDKGFYKIVKYNYYPGWHQQATSQELIINREVWDRLSTSQQAIIEMAAHEATIITIARSEATQAEVVLRNASERGVVNMTWSPQMLELFREKWEEVAAEQSAADPFFEKVYSDFTKFRESYSIWGSRAYLPRPKPAE